MNLLIIHKNGEGNQFISHLPGPGRTQHRFIDFPVLEDQSEFKWRLRGLEWQGSPPNIIVYLLTDTTGRIVGGDRLKTVIEISERDGTPLFVLIPPITSKEEQAYLESLSETVFAYGSQLFIIEDARIEQDAKALGDLVLKLAGSGLYGRYRIEENGVQLSLRPVLRRHKQQEKKLA